MRTFAFSVIFKMKWDVMGRVDDVRKRKGNAPKTPRWAVMARRFLSQAIVDLEAARENMRPRRYHFAVYHSAQAVKKGVKGAYWHLLAEEPKWTHQTDELAEAVGGHVGGVPEDVWLAIVELLSAQVVTRYPSPNIEIPIPSDLIDEASGAMAVDRAAEVLTWVESLLQLPTGKPRPK